jgi:DNA polymerase
VRENIAPVERILAGLAAMGDRLEIDGERVLYHPAPGNRPPAEVLAYLRAHKAALFAELASVRIDFETVSALDLPDVGARTYAVHPSTKVLCMAYAIGERPSAIWFPGEPLPADLVHALARPDVRVAAHNYQFEHAVWHRHQVPLGWPDIPLAHWTCTAFRARLARLPGSLDGAAAAIGLELKKDRDGRRLVLALAKRDLVAEPITDTERNKLAAYCRGDVEILRLLDRRLAEIPADLRDLFTLDFQMNARGMPTDIAAVQKLIVCRDQENLRLLAEFHRLTEGRLASPHQTARLRELLRSLGVDLPDCQRETFETWIDENPDRKDLARELIDVRLQFAHASDRKLDRMLATARESGVVRDAFCLHGAHTGRWAGRTVQLQNLPKNTLPDAAATLVALCDRADCLAAGKPVDDAAIGLPIKEAIGGVLRGLFKTLDGEVFVAGDFSQIESRILCWLSGQQNVLDQYRAGEDVYLRQAEELGSNSRDLGKLLVLSAGYGASGRVIHTRAPGFGVDLSVEAAYEITERWRSINARIVDFWHACFDHLCQCVEAPAGSAPIDFARLKIWRDADHLFVQLPSGRSLIYHQPELRYSERGSLAIDVLLPKGEQLRPASLWHGAITENIVSAIAVDLLVNAMLRLDRLGIPIVSCVHDEIVAVVPADQADRAKAVMLEIMTATPAWAPDLPLAAEVFSNIRFLKPPKDAHAPLAPSAAYRWMHCPGSVIAVTGLMDVRPSAAAEDGTESHRLFALSLQYNQDPAELTSDSRLIDPVRYALQLARRVIDGRAWRLEHRLSPLPGLPKVWGTADAVIFDEVGRVVDILDLKFGLFPVEADSLQTAIYALLAAQQFGASPDGITTHIIQPRRPHVDGPHRKHHLRCSDLDRLVIRLQEAVKATEVDGAPRIAGDWCSLCPAAPACPQRLAAPPRPFSLSRSPWFIAGRKA